MISSVGRTATSRLVPAVFARSARAFGLQPIAKSIIRTSYLYPRKVQFVRGFASADKPKAASSTKATKPKAEKKTATKAKKAAPKAKATKGKAKAKTTIKAKAKGKGKAKPKAKAVKKLSPEEKEKAKAKREIASLKELALFHEPKRLPSSAFMVFTTRKFAAGNVSVRDDMTAISKEFKQLQDFEMKELESVALQNQAANKTLYKNWVESYPADQIYKANVARKALKRKYNIPAGIKQLKRIRDERHVPKTSPFTLFCKARWASGDFKDQPVPEVSSVLAAEWRALSEAQRQPYLDQHQARVAAKAQ